MVRTSVPGQARGGLGRVVRRAERPDEIAAGSGGHHPEDGVRRHRPAVFDHPVDDLVHGAVAADRDQVALAVAQGLAGGLGGVAGMGRADDAVGEVLSVSTLSMRGSALAPPPRPALGLAMSTSGPNGLVMASRLSGS